MNAIRIFRLLIVAEVVLVVASIAVAFLPGMATPPEVDYLLAATNGAILALLFIGPVQERFAHA